MEKEGGSGGRGFYARREHDRAEHDFNSCGIGRAIFPTATPGTSSRIRTNFGLFSTGKGTTSVVPLYAIHDAASAAEVRCEAHAKKISSRHVLRNFLNLAQSEAVCRRQLRQAFSENCLSV